MIRMLLRVLGNSYARPVRGTVTLMTVTAIVEGLSYALLVPILRSLFGKDPTAAVPWLILFGAAVGGYASLRFASDYSGFRVGTTLLRGMYRRVGDQLARLPIGWHRQQRVGELTTMAGRGVLDAMSMIAHLLAPFISAAVTPLTIVLVMLVVQWQLGIAALIAVPLVAAVQVWTVRSIGANDARRAAREHEASDRTVEYLQAQPVLRAGGRTSERFRLLDDSLRGLRDTSRSSMISALPGTIGMTLTVQAIFTALLALGAYLTLGGTAGTAEILTVLVLAARCADPLLSLTDIGSQVRTARSQLASIDLLLSTEPLPRPAAPKLPEGHQIEFESVSFRYRDRTVIDNVSFRVPAGQRLGIVGPSGAGKTTLLGLIARFWDVDHGAVLMGGVDVRDIDTEALLARIAIVFQDVYLFDDTIEQNIRLGRPDATNDEVRQAATAAGLDEVIERLPDGWQTIVGEGGASLSGGERQRVSIARALLKDAPVVLLDEVTSALDPLSEAAVHEGIERLIAGRTVVMVAHRMRTVQRADRVLFLDDGGILEQGSHQELLRMNGSYADFWNRSVDLDQGSSRPLP